MKITVLASEKKIKTCFAITKEKLTEILKENPNNKQIECIYDTEWILKRLEEGWKVECLETETI